MINPQGSMSGRINCGDGKMLSKIAACHLQLKRCIDYGYTLKLGK